MRRRILLAMLSIAELAIVLFAVPLAILVERFVDEDAMRQNALTNGMVTLKQMAIRLVKDGITSLDNVEGLILED